MNNTILVHTLKLYSVSMYTIYIIQTQLYNFKINQTHYIFLKLSFFIKMYQQYLNIIFNWAKQSITLEYQIKLLKISLIAALK